MFEGQSVKVIVREDQIAELRFDAVDSPVNKLDDATTEELSRALGLLAIQEGIRGLVITSTKDVFIVGADINEFVELFRAGEENIVKSLGRQLDNCSKLEDLPFPTVAAINGYALGGGCELALACDYRVLSGQARLGLPEARLGLIPGWGGTQRLPRVAGLETAIEWISGAGHYDAQAALDAGVADELAAEEDLLERAVKLIEQCHKGKLDYQAKRQPKLEALPLSKRELNQLRKKAEQSILEGRGRYYPAQALALDAIFGGASLGRKEAMALETVTFAKAAVTDEAAAMVGNFIADQGLSRKARALEAQASKSSQNIAVLGAGIMGGGIAYTAALKGLNVRLKDVAQEGVDAGLAEADKLLAKRVKRGRMDEKKKSDVLSRIHGQLNYEQFDQTDILIEAIVEDAGIKSKVLTEVEQQVPEDTVITSNTSTISISHLAEALERPERFCGMHFFNPVHAMPLVEVIRGEKSSDDAIARTVALANRMGKKAIVVNDCPGFLVNRVLFPYFAGFAALLADGVSSIRIDAIMEDWGWPMGPAHLADVIGIDTMVHCEAVMEEGYPDRMSRLESGPMDLMLASDRLGQKSGAGFYRYTQDEKGRPQKQEDTEVEAVLEPVRAGRFEITDDEIVTRMMLPMMTEMARCLEENIVDNPAEADLSLLYGLGFPDFRGGIFRTMDAAGVDSIVEQAKPFAGLGKLYEPTEGMLELAKNGGRYYS